MFIYCAGPRTSTAEQTMTVLLRNLLYHLIHILPASCYWDRTEAKKTEGCMADGMRCCIWGRAQNPGSVSLDLRKGWTNMRTLHMTRAGNLGLSMVELAWTAGSGLPEPLLLSLMPMLQYLPQKLVHFVLDYHPRWIAGLGLPTFDGTHRHL